MVDRNTRLIRGLLLAAALIVIIYFTLRYLTRRMDGRKKVEEFRMPFTPNVNNPGLQKPCCFNGPIMDEQFYKDCMFIHNDKVRCRVGAIKVFNAAAQTNPSIRLKYRSNMPTEQRCSNW